MAADRGRRVRGALRPEHVARSRLEQRAGDQPVDRGVLDRRAQDHREQLRNLTALRGRVERVFEPVPDSLLDPRLRPAETVAGRSCEREDERLAGDAEAAAARARPSSTTRCVAASSPCPGKSACAAHGDAIRTGDELTCSATSTAINASAAQRGAQRARASLSPPETEEGDRARGSREGCAEGERRPECGRCRLPDGADQLVACAGEGLVPTCAVRVERCAQVG